MWIQDHHGNTDVLVADLPIVLRSRLRTATLGEISFEADGGLGFSFNTVSSKLFALRGVLDGWGAQPVLILTDSKRFAKVTAARMKAAGFNAEEWSGDITTANRSVLKERFIAGEVQYLVAVIPAISTGIDGLQDVCSKIVWLSESENGMQNAQAVARIFRPGMTTKYGEFEHVKILARDTYDFHVFGRLIAAHINMADTLRLAA